MQWWVWLIVAWLGLGLLVALTFGLLARGAALRERAEAPREPALDPMPAQRSPAAVRRERH